MTYQREKEKITPLIMATTLAPLAHALRSDQNTGACQGGASLTCLRTQEAGGFSPFQTILFFFTTQIFVIHFPSIFTLKSAPNFFQDPKSTHSGRKVSE
jgi:hypothetical protein